ncbi:MAG: PDZ domain-containing protein [Dehalococcoidia bacterium]|nr:MAG: PDZ domain-containing protein [Dehalococcoidia bacterium]
MTRVNGWLLSAVAGVVVASALIGGAVALSAFGGSTTVTNISPAAPRPSVPVQQTTGAQAGGIADVVERVRPSVVRIESSATNATGTAGSSGTGMVLDREGRILTNYHVIEGQRDLKVMLADGTASKATVLGSDPGSDLAVLKVEVASNLLTPVTFGDSDAVRVGDAVFAIGNPFGQNFSVSAGIVSATGRVSTSSFTGRAIRDVLQTDAALNPGNSGGPLFNLKGEVVGVNSSIENPNGRFFVGLGYAIPSNTAQRFLPSMAKGQDVRHPLLGISVVQLDDVVAADLGLRVTRGVYVTGVTPGGAAARAGIQAASRGTTARTTGAGGDVITAVGGQPVRNFEELARAIDKHEVGEAVKVELVRNGQSMTVSAELQEWDLR